MGGSLLALIQRWRQNGLYFNLDVAKLQTCFETLDVRPQDASEIFKDFWDYKKTRRELLARAQQRNYTY